MKNITKSLIIISAVAALAIGGTIAYFSDTEQSTGNTFTAGTIDIAIDQHNPWTSKYHIGDLKPGETGYINFDISNVGKNPVNVSKNLSKFVESTGTQSEPECVDQHGAWDNTNKVCDWTNCVANGGTLQSDGTCDTNDVQTQIIYDLSVKVYKSAGENELIWWQAIYTDAEGKKLSEVYPNGGTGVALGMIPVGGHMKVTQSYHFKEGAGNEYQGDQLSFNVTIKGDQLTQENGYASVKLENKTLPDWNIVQGDSIEGTLSYKTNGSEFEYSFTGKAPLNSHGYVLAVGYNASTDVDKQIGTGTTNSSGDIIISGSVATGDLTNAKAWLVPTENWNYPGMNWSNWPTCVPNILWETGLINYDQN